MKKKKTYDSWKRDILQHLTDYKIKMGITEDGVSRGKTYSHILPLQLGKNNYICDKAKSLDSSVARHSNWNHLNSSQAMCWNFFAPMLNNDYLLLNRFLNNELNRNNIKIVDSQFEYNYCSGVGRKGTEFDFWCKDSQNHNYYFEIKYTENGITKKTKAKDPRDIYERIYKELIKPKNYLSKYKEDWEVLMLKHYQTFRNIVMSDESAGNYSIFITMKGNPATRKELLGAFSDFGSSLEEVEKGVCMKYVKSLYWEEIIPKVVAMCTNREKEIYTEFKRKYLLNE